jgi:hypothetical protein
MNSEGSEKKRWSDLKYHPSVWLEEQRKTSKISVKIVDALSEIRTGLLTNTTQKYYRWSQVHPLLIVLFLVMTPCSLVHVFGRFGADSCEMLVTAQTTRCHDLEDGSINFSQSWKSEIPYPCLVWLLAWPPHCKENPREPPAGLSISSRRHPLGQHRPQRVLSSLEDVINECLVKPHKNSHLFRVVTTSSTCVYDWTTVGLASVVAVSTAHSFCVYVPFPASSCNCVHLHTWLWWRKCRLISGPRPCVITSKSCQYSPIVISVSSCHKHGEQYGGA